MTTRCNALSGTPVNIVLCRLQPSTQSTVECTCGCIQVRQKIIMECAYLNNRLIWCSLLKTNFCSINFRYKFFYLKEIKSELKILWSKLIKHCFHKINGFSLYHGKWNSLNIIYVLTIAREVPIYNINKIKYESH